MAPPKDLMELLIGHFTFKIYFYLKSTKKMLATGIEPVTVALLEPRSTDWAKRAAF